MPFKCWSSSHLACLSVKNNFLSKHLQWVSTNSLRKLLHAPIEITFENVLLEFSIFLLQLLPGCFAPFDNLKWSPPLRNNTSTVGYTEWSLCWVFFFFFSEEKVTNFLTGKSQKFCPREDLRETFWDSACIKPSKVIPRATDLALYEEIDGMCAWESALQTIQSANVIV